MEEKATIRQIAVIGAGTMGAGITQLFASGGYEVNLYNRTSANLDKALTQIRGNLEALAGLNELHPEEIPGILARIHKTSDLREAVAGADVIIESVAEVEEVKRNIFREINRFCKETAIIASDTSAMDIFQFVQVSRMNRLCIMHFFLPAYAIPLVELVRGLETSDETVARARALLESVGKNVAVLNKIIPGFIVNRVTLAIFREVNHIAAMGVATPEDIDKALVSVYGPRLAFEGPFGLCDFAGADIYQRLSEELFPELSTASDCPELIRGRVEEGKLGIKSGGGFYSYGNAVEEAGLRNARIIRMIQAIREVNSDVTAHAGGGLHGTKT